MFWFCFISKMLSIYFGLFELDCPDGRDCFICMLSNTLVYSYSRILTDFTSIYPLSCHVWSISITLDSLGHTHSDVQPLHIHIFSLTDILVSLVSITTWHFHWIHHFIYFHFLDHHMCDHLFHHDNIVY
jgi:hypothetical protein